MSQAFVVKRIAVLGAGVMGSQIAALTVSAGFETLLFDLTDALVAHTCAQVRNYDDHLAELATCDLIIEAIAERLDWKEALYQRISPHLSAHCILVSNTSGLSINRLAAVCPPALRTRFCGVHFFNPPRYMHLVELIAAKETAASLLDQLETWLTSFLGKGVIRAYDTPNFIANRLGVFSLLVTMHYADKFKLAPDEVDALTGTLLGRPKSATYRTLDVVGLDTLKHVVTTMREQLPDDPWHTYFQLPSWLEQLISAGALGQKSGSGV